MWGRGLDGPPDRRTVVAGDWWSHDPDASDSGKPCWDDAHAGEAPRIPPTSGLTIDGGAACHTAGAGFHTLLNTAASWRGRGQRRSSC